jgi:vancomycin resistance protein YoaR
MHKILLKTGERITGFARLLDGLLGQSRHPFVRDGVIAVVLACLGALCALTIFEPWKGPAPAVPRILIDRLEMATGNERQGELIKLARDRLQSPVVLQVGDFEYRTSWAELGTRVDLQSLGQLLVSLAQENGSSAKYYLSEGEENKIPAIALPIALGAETAVEALVALKERIDRPPINAKFDFLKKKVIAEQVGLSLDVYATLEKLDAALEKEISNITMASERVQASVSAADLEEIHVDVDLGHFQTPYSRMRKDRDRTHNVRLGASRLDGQVILPGEVISFNDILGDRSEARGFRYAPVIAGGAIVEGMGGGTCQVASTLYAASFFAGLVIVDRQPHSRPSSYIKLGLDATVSYPDLDLQLRNPFPFPVVIHFTSDDGKLRAEIRGARRLYTVTFLRKIIGNQKFTVRTIDDSKLPRGKEIITQNGIPGYTVRRYQIIETDKISYRFQTVDKYPPTTQFVHRGTGDPGAENPDAPKPDMHKPYHASSYLRMVQGPDDLWYEQSHE